MSSSKMLLLKWARNWPALKFLPIFASGAHLAIFSEKLSGAEKNRFIERFSFRMSWSTRLTFKLLKNASFKMSAKLDSAALKILQDWQYCKKLRGFEVCAFIFLQDIDEISIQEYNQCLFINKIYLLVFQEKCLEIRIEISSIE